MLLQVGRKSLPVSFVTLTFTLFTDILLTRSFFYRDCKSLVERYMQKINAPNFGMSE